MLLTVAGIGQAMSLLSCIVIIQQRFSKHRSLATGISVIGWSMGNFMGAPLTEALYNRYGLRGTLALLGAIELHRIPLSLQFQSPKHFIANVKQTQVDGWLVIEISLASWVTLWLVCAVVRLRHMNEKRTVKGKGTDTCYGAS